ncbi:glutaredoxin family protein [Dendrosporobacter sp. 1207_IL3150]|uniref:glutaredoxin family protein n=1 Tax=Dendrosporobacter sp. 1207_IL3150 TaxID=3084054 RepID=UPI002FDB5921
MKPILMFTMGSCPHCQRALAWMEELKKENPKYLGLDISMIDENVQPSVASKYDYYYVPTYFIDDIKVHEGVPTKGIIRKIFETAIE